ncbi:hypothetical protein Efla_005577 [Eimeria flavescens]
MAPGDPCCLSSVSLPPPPGLVNLGRTCSFNVLLQALAATRTFSTLYSSCDLEGGPPGGAPSSPVQPAAAAPGAAPGGGAPVKPAAAAPGGAAAARSSDAAHGGGPLAAWGGPPQAAMWPTASFARPQGAERGRPLTAADAVNPEDTPLNFQVSKILSEMSLDARGGGSSECSRWRCSEAHAAAAAAPEAAEAAAAREASCCGLKHRGRRRCCVRRGLGGREEEGSTPALGAARSAAPCFWGGGPLGAPSKRVRRDLTHRVLNPTGFVQQMRLSNSEFKEDRELDVEEIWRFLIEQIFVELQQPLSASSCSSSSSSSSEAAAAGSLSSGLLPSLIGSANVTPVKGGECRSPLRAPMDEEGAGGPVLAPHPGLACGGGGGSLPCGAGAPHAGNSRRTRVFVEGAAAATAAAATRRSCSGSLKNSSSRGPSWQGPEGPPHPSKLSRARSPVKPAAAATAKAAAAAEGCGCARVHAGERKSPCLWGLQCSSGPNPEGAPPSPEVILSPECSSVRVSSTSSSCSSSSCSSRSASVAASPASAAAADRERAAAQLCRRLRNALCGELVHVAVPCCCCPEQKQQQQQQQQQVEVFCGVLPLRMPERSRFMSSRSSASSKLQPITLAECLQLTLCHGCDGSGAAPASEWGGGPQEGPLPLAALPVSERGRAGGEGGPSQQADQHKGAPQGPLPPLTGASTERRLRGPSSRQTTRARTRAAAAAAAAAANEAPVAGTERAADASAAAAAAGGQPVCCRRCGAPHRRTLLRRLPPLILLQLPRSTVPLRSSRSSRSPPMSSVKLKAHVQFPLELQGLLLPYLGEPAAAADSSSSSGSSCSAEALGRYRLRAVIEHQGRNGDGGHYVCYRRGDSCLPFQQQPAEPAAAAAATTTTTADSRQAASSRERSYKATSSGGGGRGGPPQQGKGRGGSLQQGGGAPSSVGGEEEDVWWTVNDVMVQRSSWEEVSRTQAYLLLYELNDQQQQQQLQQQGGAEQEGRRGPVARGSHRKQLASKNACSPKHPRLTPPFSP